MKVMRDMCDFHRIHPSMVKRIDYADQVVEEISSGQQHWTTTSLLREDKGDHGKGCGCDGRAFFFERESDCVLVEQLVNQQFPALNGERQTLKYWHPGNSTRLRCLRGHWKVDPTKLAVPPIQCPVCGAKELKLTSYPQHFHLRCEANGWVMR